MFQKLTWLTGTLLLMLNCVVKMEDGMPLGVFSFHHKALAEKKKRAL
jgi:hypothetical protein